MVVFFAAVVFFEAAVFFSAVFFEAVAFFEAAALDVFDEVVFFAAVFRADEAPDAFAEAVFFASGLASAGSPEASPSAGEAAFFFGYLRFSSGTNSGQASFTQNFLHGPLPPGLKRVLPQVGQTSFVGTSQVMKPQSVPRSQA